MPKTVFSPVDRFSGSVTLADPMTMAQVLAYETALLETRQLIADQQVDGNGDAVPQVLRSAYDQVLLPAIFACVEEWVLEGVPSRPTTENFPFSPRQASSQLIAWLIGEIRTIYRGDAVPK